MRDALAYEDIALVVVGFSPPEAMWTLAGHLGLDGLVLSDVDRSLYRLLGLGRAPVWRVYSPGTLARYAAAVARGHRLTAPVEDTRQLGGDAVFRGGAVRRIRRPRSPSDRVSVRALLAGARGVAGAADDG